MQHNDYRYVSELFIDFPKKIIILDIPNDKLEDLKETIIEYSKISNNFICQIYNLKEIKFFTKNNIKFFYGYSVDNYYDIRGLISLGVEYIKINAPITFNMKLLSNLNVKFRMIPNVAYDAYIPRENGIKGQWVRPEDTKYYEKGIYIFDFADCDLEKERTLYHIYAENRTWPGNLNILITNLNVNADNRGFPDELGEIRSNCQQKCMQNGSCHFCDTAFKFERTIRKYKEEFRGISRCGSGIDQSGY